MRDTIVCRRSMIADANTIGSIPRPTSTKDFAPAAISSAGWNRAMYVPFQQSLPSASRRAQASPLVMWTSWPQACMTPSFSEA